MADAYNLIPEADYIDACNAIREKDGSTALIKSAELGTKIRAIQTGTDTSDATATAAEIFKGKTAYANGEKLIGTMADASTMLFGSVKLSTIWGNETEVGNNAWWNSVKTAVAASTQEERAACLGKTKRVSLSSPVLGSNQVLMRCVGYDLDGSKTLAFAAVSALAAKSTFGSSGRWINSNARLMCHEFYNACSAKDSILTVSKGTCYNTSNSKNDTPAYNDETVFLMSERELGLDGDSPISAENSNPTKAECTYGYNASYQYFTDNSKRIFKLGDANGNPTETDSWAFTRSLTYYNLGLIVILNNSGGSRGGNAIGSNGILPAFVIGQA